jgi:hypothetical protein
MADVRPNDAINAGVALRAAGPEIVVHPYTFRQVCTNGAIAAHSFGSRRLERVASGGVYLPEYETAVVLSKVRDAVRASVDPHAFAQLANEIRSTLDVEADLALHLAPMLAHMPSQLAERMMPRILRHFHEGDDRSAFGLMNAITSVARDADDVETRWTLEQIGGTLPALLAPGSLSQPKPASDANNRFANSSAE